MNSDANRPDHGELARAPHGAERHAARPLDLTLAQYEAGVQSGDVTVLARALTLIESTTATHAALAEELLSRLLPATKRALRVGISGAPGVGKSTFIEALGIYLIEAKLRVAVLAVDPSSAISGGSILGDKTRMVRLAAQPRAYIRPSPSAGTLGGVARRTRESIVICEAAGYDVVLVETVGVGQSETMVADMTDCFVALVAPGAGDELQGIKRGLLELVDLLVVNKADGASRAAAELAAEQYTFALQWLGTRDRRATPHVLTCSALHNERIDTVWATIHQRYGQMQASGELAERQREQNLRWLWATVHDQLASTVDRHPAVQAMRADLERQVADGSISSTAAARQIIKALGFWP